MPLPTRLTLTPKTLGDELVERFTSQFVNQPGKTGIRVNGEKWLTIIQNASKENQ